MGWVVGREEGRWVLAAALATGKDRAMDVVGREDEEVYVLVGGSHQHTASLLNMNYYNL